jgi:predicted porin
VNSTTKYIFAGVAAALAAGEACAQQASSQVVIYGIAAACAARSDIGPTTSYRVSSGCQAGSRFGFRGTEQLGEGTAAHFTLENGFNIDDGSSGQGGPSLWPQGVHRSVQPVSGQH